MSRGSVFAFQQHAVPLLKFTDDKAVLSESGLRRIEKLKGPIYPIILMGDGRAGKSYLASRTLDLPEVFESSDSPESVTEGIDVVTLDAEVLANKLGTKEKMCDLVVLDCEGGNNAMAAIRTLVNVFAVLIAKEVCFVTGNSFSEAGLQSLGATLAAKQLIRMGDEQGQQQKLLYCVNKNMIKYDGDALEKALTEEHGDAARKDNRRLIRSSFPERKFITVPMFQTEGFEEAVQAIRLRILEDRAPFTIQNMPANGRQLAGLMRHIVREMESMNEVDMPSMTRAVLMDGFLVPLIERLASQAREKTPAIKDYVKDLALQDPRAAATVEFSRETSHLTDKALLEEARATLGAQLDKDWKSAELTNAAFGKQTMETKKEERQKVKDRKRVHIKALLFDQVAVTKQLVRTEERNTTVFKDGTEDHTDWKAIGSKTVVEEDAFSDLENVPKLEGIIRVRMERQGIGSFLLGPYWREQYCWVGDGHFVWWESKTTVKGKTCPAGSASGALSLLLNRSEVQLDECDPYSLNLAPMQDGGEEAATWADTSGFAAPSQGAFVLSTEGCTRSRSEWEEAIRKNIEFAAKARGNLGDSRIVNEIGTGLQIRKKVKDLPLEGEQGRAARRSQGQSLPIDLSALGITTFSCCGSRPGRTA